MKKILIFLFFIIITAFAAYYFYPESKLPANAKVDYILVDKSERKLQAFYHKKLLKTYKIALGKNPVGDKKYEGDGKTPEGIYTINAKNPNSGYHKNLGISYPNAEDVNEAKKLGKPTGGDVKIHALKNGHGYIGKFQRWRDWTNGCVALTDQEVDELYSAAAVGTKIEIVP